MECRCSGKVPFEKCVFRTKASGLSGGRVGLPDDVLVKCPFCKHPITRFGPASSVSPETAQIGIKQVSRPPWPAPRGPPPPRPRDPGCLGPAVNPPPRTPDAPRSSWTRAAL